MSPRTFRKKVRGYTRRKKQLEALSQSYQNSDLSELDQYEYQYAKFRMRPLYNLHLHPSGDVKRTHPPRGFQQEIYRELYAIYAAWKTKLDALGEAYYLRVWINIHDPISSQVVAAIGEKIDHYQDLLQRMMPKEQPVPQYLNPDLTWEYREYGYRTLDSDIPDDEARQETKKNASVIESVTVNESPDLLYFVPIEKFWVGR